jgi:hypothetical protein
MDARRFNQIDNDALEFPAIRISSKHEQCLTHCWTIGVTSFVLLVKGGEDQTKLEIRSWTEPTVSPLHADGITLSFSQLEKIYSLVKGAHDAVISSLFVLGGKLCFEASIGGSPEVYLKFVRFGSDSYDVSVNFTISQDQFNFVLTLKQWLAFLKLRQDIVNVNNAFILPKRRRSVC